MLAGMVIEIASFNKEANSPVISTRKQPHTHPLAVPGCLLGRCSGESARWRLVVRMRTAGRQRLLPHPHLASIKGVAATVIRIP